MPQISQIPGFHFSPPLEVFVEQEGPWAWLARIAILDLWADGETEDAAIEEVRLSLMSLVDDIYDAPLARLGPGPQRWQATLRRIARRESPSPDHLAADQRPIT